MLYVKHNQQVRWSARDKKGRLVEQFGCPAEDFDQVFTLELLGSFNTSAIQRDVDKRVGWMRMGKLDLTDDFFKYLMTHMDVDKKRLAELLRLDAPAQAHLMKPVLALETKVDPVANVIELTLVDGVHRCIAGYMLGAKILAAWCVQGFAIEKYKVWWEITELDGSKRRIESMEVLNNVWGHYGAVRGL